MRWRKRALAVFGLALLGVALHVVGGREILEALRRANLASLAGAAAAIVASTLLGAYNVHRITRLDQVMDLRRFLLVFWRSWAVGISMPGQVGDMLTTIWQLKGQASANLGFIAGRLLADKAVSLACSLGLAALAPWALGLGAPLASALLLVALVLAGAAIWCATRWYSKRPSTGHGWRARLRPVLDAASVPVPVLAGNAAITLLKLALTGLAYWLVLSSLHDEAPDYLATTIVAQSAGLVAYLPVSFNGLGTVEISAIALFGAIGVPGAVVLSSYLILRALTLALAWLPTLWWSARAQ